MLQPAEVQLGELDGLFGIEVSDQGDREVVQQQRFVVDEQDQARSGRARVRSCLRPVFRGSSESYGGE